MTWNSRDEARTNRVRALILALLPPLLRACALELEAFEDTFMAELGAIQYE